MTKIISRKGNNNLTETNEGKTLFEHIGLTGKKTGTGTGIFDKMGRYLKSMALFVILGFLIGTILDIMLKTNYYGSILAIGMLILWILKAFGADLKPPMRRKK
jgi:hypothetical protein